MDIDLPSSPARPKLEPSRQTIHNKMPRSFGANSNSASSAFASDASETLSKSSEAPSEGTGGDGRGLLDVASVRPLQVNNTPVSANSRSDNSPMDESPGRNTRASSPTLPYSAADYQKLTRFENDQKSRAYIEKGQVSSQPTQDSSQRTQDPTSSKTSK